MLAVPRHQSKNSCLYHFSIDLVMQYNTQMDEYSRKVADITPDYLLNLSKQVDLISKHYQHHRLGPLTQDFSNALTVQFNELTHYLTLYQVDSVMRACSLYRCKIQLELYSLSKIAVLVGRENSEISNIIDQFILQIREIFTNM